jgi:uncharacterized protein (TIGR00369 family)
VVSESNAGKREWPDGSRWQPASEGDRWGQALGLEISEVTPERVVARLMPDERHHQPYGVLHGGVWCSIVEGVASYGAGRLAAEMGQTGVLGTSNHTDFLRSHSHGQLDCIGTPLHAGRSMQLWEVRITRASDGKLVARGQVRFHVLSELPDERKGG